MGKVKDRIRAVDFVRGFSVLMMIPVHVMMLYASTNTWENTITGSVVQYLERGTPIFLIVMGISFAFSRNSNKKGLLKKALMIISLGYILNFLRFLVPVLFFGGFPEKFIEASGLKLSDPYSMLNYFLKGDIFQLVGISLFFIGLTFKFLIKNKNVLLILVLAVMWISKIVSGIQLGIPGVDYLLNLLWGDNFDVYFPLFPWVSFILMGLYLGLRYKENPDNIDKSLFRPIIYLGVIFLVIGKLLCNYNYEYHFGDYYHLGPGGSMGMMGIILVIFWLFYQTERILPKDNYVSKLFFYCSKNVTTFYMIQWVVIYWLMTFVGFSILNEPAVLVVMSTVYLATFSLLYVVNKYVVGKKNKKDKKIPQAV